MKNAIFMVKAGALTVVYTVWYCVGAALICAPFYGAYKLYQKWEVKRSIHIVDDTDEDEEP